MIKKISLAIVAALCFASLSANASQWNWQIHNTTGTFTTTGTGNAAGNYSLIDFSVTSSGDGAAVGSLSGGQYAANGYATNLPYAFNWNGSAVTLWDSAGSNTFDWWVFDDLSSSQFIFFGWATTNINDVAQGAIVTAGLGASQPSYAVRVTPAGNQVPEPAPLALLACGALAALAIRRRR